MKKIKKTVRSIRGISTPIGGVSWEPEGIGEKWVDINYPMDSGIQKELENCGYKLAWCNSRKKLARKIDIEGWELVVRKDQDGKEFVLKCGDADESLTLIKKSTKEV